MLQVHNDITIQRILPAVAVTKYSMAVKTQYSREIKTTEAFFLQG